MTVIQSIQNRMDEFRSERGMLDFDLAWLYEVPTKALNQAVKRNIKRFPADFMFRLSQPERPSRRSQIVTASRAKRNTGLTPYAFTEQGVAMLRGILNSGKAIAMNIAIRRAFVETRKILLLQNDVRQQLKEIKNAPAGTMHNQMQ